MSNTISSNNMQIFVKTLNGTSIPLDVTQSTTVAELKTRVHDSQGIVIAQQRLIFGGKQLQDDYTMGHYNIQTESTVNLTLRLIGGQTFLEKFPTFASFTIAFDKQNTSSPSITSEIICDLYAKLYQRLNDTDIDTMNYRIFLDQVGNLTREKKGDGWVLDSVFEKFYNDMCDELDEAIANNSSGPPKKTSRNQQKFMPVSYHALFLAITMPIVETVDTVPALDRFKRVQTVETIPAADEIHFVINTNPTIETLKNPQDISFECVFSIRRAMLLDAMHHYHDVAVLSGTTGEWYKKTSLGVFKIWHEGKDVMPLTTELHCEITSRPLPIDESKRFNYSVGRAMDYFKYNKPERVAIFSKSKNEWFINSINEPTVFGVWYDGPVLMT